MHYTGQVYRPPLEAYTPLLEVTIGCSHNKCAFCTMYKQTPFSLAPKENIEADLKELSNYDSFIDRIYLLNGDPFVLSTDKLVDIANMIHSNLSNVKTITCYASFYNLKNKSVDELKKLKSLGYNELYIGVESGYDKVLSYLNKGANLDEYKEGLEKLKEASIEYHAIIMLGIAGRGNSKINAQKTAEFLNLYPPRSVFPMTTDVQKGSMLYEMRKNGLFEEATIREILEEQIELVENLQLDDNALYSSAHAVNMLSIRHRFKNKDKILEKLHYALNHAPDEILNSTNQRVAR
ncbi:MAG: radical SAM protein [Peptoniphilaceae bacterium]|nr:radical SAM protein [Peptoniphilaceae bacterium]MDY6018161.1 radical SAM protein [Anaerococcus sp.]